MDTDISKRLFRAAGILTPDCIMAPGQPRDVEAVLGYRVIVKPNAQGSTIGLSLVRGASDLDSAVSTAASYGDAIIEQFVPGRELTVGVLDGQALAVGEVLLERNSVFSYEEKYQAGPSKRSFRHRFRLTSKKRRNVWLSSPITVSSCTTTAGRTSVSMTTGDSG